VAQSCPSFGNLAEFGAADSLGIMILIDLHVEIWTTNVGQQNAWNAVQRPACSQTEGNHTSFTQGGPRGYVFVPVPWNGRADLFVSAGREPEPVPGVDVDRHAVNLAVIGASIEQA